MIAHFAEWAVKMVTISYCAMFPKTFGLIFMEEF